MNIFQLELSNDHHALSQGIEGLKATLDSLIKMYWGANFQSVEPFLKNSIFYIDPMYKSICRVAEILLKPELVIAGSVFSSETLRNIVERTDTISPRDYLYEINLQQECAFALPIALSDTAPWEDVLKPLAQIKQNAENGCLVNIWITESLILMVIILMNSSAKLNGDSLNYSPLVRHLNLCHSSCVEQAFVAALDEMKLQQQVEHKGGSDV